MELAVERGQLNQELKEKVHDSMARAEQNLLDKYSFVEYEEVLNRNRTKALKVRLIKHSECNPPISPGEVEFLNQYSRFSVGHVHTILE